MYRLTLALLTVAAAHAQLTATLRTPAGRSPEVELRNDSQQAVIAIALRMPAAEADAPPFLFFRDAAVDAAPLPLAQSQTYAVDIPIDRRRRPLYTAPIDTAALFADSSSTGDPALVASLMLRRRNMLQAVELARDLLAAASKRNVPRAQLTKQFQQLADSLDHWYLPAEQQVGRMVYQSIVGKLLNLPDQRLGDPFPPTAFVTEELAALDRQRTTLMAAIPR